ncbi:MAG: NAD(P)/FAD-dependent oxidoreductase [bacterium]
MPDSKPSSVLIIGGGFAGLRTALDLTRRARPNLHITLVSDRPDFQYPPTLYRVVTGRDKRSSSVPLKELLKGRDIKIVTDTITAVDPAAHTATGKSGGSYSFDYLVLAIGSQPSYFHIEGLQELSYGFKTLDEALRLRKHLDEVLTLKPGEEKDEQVVSANFMIVGGGPCGVELAGELGHYARSLAKKHKFDPSLITIDLIEAAPRVLPPMTPAVSAKVEAHLRDLGVNVFINKTVVKEEVEQLLLKDMSVKTKTVVWTAGVKPHALYSQIAGLELDKRGKVVVDELLQAKGFPGIFILGDAASTQYAGLAQTALHDGNHAAQAILAHASGSTPLPYAPAKPASAIPVGDGWAVTVYMGMTFYGRMGWWLRRAADLRFFFTIMSPALAISTFRRDR